MDVDKHGIVGLDKTAIDGLDKIAIDDRAAAAVAYPLIDEVAEKKLMRKVDLHVIPALTILFLMAFLDRTNIGRFPL